MNGLTKTAAALLLGVLAGSGHLSAQTPQTINFDSIPNQIFGISPFPMAVEASSRLPIVLNSTTPAVCTNASLLVTLLGAGTCSITATQAGNAAFSPAPPVTRSFSVNPANPASTLATGPGSPLAVGSGPQPVAVGDFNRDGNQDLAVANFNDSTVTVLLGDGAGGLTAATGSPFKVGSGPISIVIGDFNGDGIPDLATADDTSNDVTVLLGNGLGGFKAAQGSPFATGANPNALAVGDFNGDGIQDLAVANFTDSTVTVLSGNGSGGFLAAANSPFAVGANPVSIAVADFNRDGFEDLVTADFGQSTVTVLLGSGSGGFTPAANSPFAVGDGPASVAVGDFNADGKQDLGVANFDDSTVTVLLGDGIGGFTGTTNGPVQVGNGPVSGVVADFNGDGFLDFATANFNDNTITVLLGNGSGNFSAVPISVGTEPVSLAVADFNGDGIPGLAVANFGGNDVTVLLGGGTTAQTITFGSLSSVEVGVAPFTISATASSSLAVFFNSTTTGVCTVSGNTVTIVATGTCSITANQDGNATYAAAESVPQSFAVFAPGAAGPLSIGGSFSFGEIALGSSVSTSFGAMGGVPPYTWSATSLPAGLTLNPKTGALTGTPTSAGNSSFSIAVGDTASGSATLALTLRVLGFTTPSSLPGATVGKAYSRTFAAAGGSGTYTFTASNVPAGFTFSGSTLTGTPATAGTFTFRIQVGDASQTVATSSFTLVVAPVFSILSSSAPGEIAFGSNVAATLKAIGGTPPYSWLAMGLPAGVTLNASSGALAGSPAQPGNYTFTVQVSDAETPASATSITVTLRVLGLTTPAALPSGSTMAAYSQTFSAAGGTGSYTFFSPNLPPGLSFNGGTLSGTPSTVGSYSFTVQVSDSNGISAASPFSLIVTGPATPLNINGGAVTNGAAGTLYSQALTGTGGAPPYTWSIIGGALPAGLALSGSVISGTPSAPGTSTFTAQATDSSHASSSGVFTLTIAPQPLTLSGLPFPNGIAGSDYPAQVPTGAGGVGPYTFTVGSGSLPAGLSLANGQISGIPTTAGTSAFSITMTDSETPALSIASPAQIVVSAAGSANLLLSAGSLAFNLALGAAGLPAPQSVTVESSVVNQLLNYSVVATPAVSWLDATGGGTTPGGIGIALDPSALNLGASSTPLTTALEVTCLAPSPCAGLSQTIAVSLSVTALPPQLTFTTNLVQFSANVPATATLSQQVAIRNVGGGSAAIDSVSAGAAWLTVGGLPAAVAAGQTVGIVFTANPAGLGAGFFRTTVTIESSSGTVTVPVTLEIATSPALTLSASGAQFQSTLGSAPVNTSGSFQVATTSGMPVNWTATVLPGAPWLQVSQTTASGLASSSSPGTVGYNVAAGSLTSAQPYYGVIQLTAGGVTNSPWDYLVVVNVAAPTALPVPVLKPAGLLFESGFGSGAPPAQSVAVYGSSGSGAAYSASADTTDGHPWLIVSPTSGTSSTSGSQVTSAVTVKPGTLPAGVYTGTVSYQFSAAAVRSVNVTMIVAPPASTTSASTVCTPTQLVPTPTGLLNNFAQPASWPTPLSVQVVNNCGESITNGQVTATFSNGDPPLALNLDPATGLYAGAWTPQTASGQVAITATVTAPGFSSATSTVTGEVLANPAPLLAPGGTLHVYNPLLGGAVGQGTILQIFGSNLSASAMQATMAPLPTALGGTSVTIGGIAAPLYYASPNQIDAQLPYELVPGNSYQVFVNNNGAIGVPNAIQIAAATPGVAASASGQIIAQHANYSLVSETSPAVPGQYLVIYLSGLGLTNHAVADGAAAPNSPLSNPLVAPTLTLNGTGIPISFAGLTPSAVGLYQINFQVPPGTPNGNWQLVVSQGGQSSNPVILPVHN